MNTKINLWLAAGSSLVLSVLVWLDPTLTWRDCIGVHIGIWSMVVGQGVVQIIQDQNKHQV